jgi:hypothetical protein
MSVPWIRFGRNCLESPVLRQNTTAYGGERARSRKRVVLEVVPRQRLDQ